MNAHAFILDKKSENQKYYDQFIELFNIITQTYVDSPDKQKMLDASIQGMLSSLDQYSIYLVKDELKEFMESIKGEFCGIGVEITNENGLIRIISPIEDLPAEQAGITSGDFIIAIDGEATSDMSFNQAVKRIRGSGEGTKVKLTVIKENQNKPVDYEITRAIVKVKSIKYKLDNNIAYIRITTFSENTAKEFQETIKSIKNNKDIEGIILDVRNNPGGLVEQVVDITQYFLKSGTIFSTKGRIESSFSTYSANPNSLKAPDVPVIVLINGGSASASEILAGALQDQKRGIILGTKSYGKASVQVVMPIGSEKAIKITTAKYYTPSGKSIQDSGIEPDIKVAPGKILSLKDIFEKEKKIQSNNKAISEIQKERSELYKKDIQYARAYDLIKGLNIIKNADTDTKN